MSTQLSAGCSDFIFFKTVRWPGKQMKWHVGEKACTALSTSTQNFEVDSWQAWWHCQGTLCLPGAAAQSSDFLPIHSPLIYHAQAGNAVFWGGGRHPPTNLCFGGLFLRQVFEVQGTCHSQKRCHPSRMHRCCQAQTPYIDGFARSRFSFGCMNAALTLDVGLCTANGNQTNEHTAHSSLLRIHFFQKSLFLQFPNRSSLG